MPPKPLKSRLLLTLMIVIVSVVSITSCASSKKEDGDTTTNSKKKILPRPGQARRVAVDTPIVTYIKNANGDLTKIFDTAKAGEYIVPDPGPKKPDSEAIKSAPNAEVVPGTAK